MGTKYSTRDEAIEREIVEPIETSGVVKDARAEYDVNGIAGEVLEPYVTAGNQYYWRRTVDHDAFWQSVARHARLRLTRGGD